LKPFAAAVLHRRVTAEKEKTMHRRLQTSTPGLRLAVSMIACLALLAPRMARATDAPTAYTFQPLAQIGGIAGDVPIPTSLIW
jgi:hypothetical protein